MYLIENELLKVEVKNSGAELCSMVRKSDDKEYIWQADPAYWKRHAPILFPVVGTLNPERGLHMGRHGFARDMEFKCVEKTSTSMVLELKADEASKAVYPYDFVLRISYDLNGAQLRIGYEVTNKGIAEMPFSIGAHPAFNCDLEAGAVTLEFEKEEPLECLLLDLEKGLLNGETEMHVMNGRELPIRPETFDKDALVFKGLQSEWIKVVDSSTDTKLRVSYTGFPYMGIWSPGAPFVCIEPWYGVTDSLEDKGPLHQKEGIIILEPGKTFNAVHSIEALG